MLITDRDMGQRQVVLCGEGPGNSRQPGTCAQPSQAWEPGCCNLGFAPNRELQGGYEAAWSGPSRNAGLWAALPACTTDRPHGDAVRVLSPAVKTGVLKQAPPRAFRPSSRREQEKSLATGARE